MSLQIADAGLRERLAAFAAEETVLVSDGPVDPAVATLVLVEPDQAVAALAAGAAGVLSPTAGTDLVGAAVAALRAGLVVLAPAVLARLVPGAPAQRAALTPRERDVLALLAQGASNKEIARRLGISVHTAKFHVGQITDKLDASGRTEAVARALMSTRPML